MHRTTPLLLAAVLSAQAADKYDPATDPFKVGGNPPPSITTLTPEQEAEILKEVTVPEGFDLSLFATSSAANYPVFIAAAPNGDLYVSSDGNGAQGTAPRRGRVIRLRDTDGDGRADETVEFVKELDAPRGLLWDHDRLYVVHPPHLDAFIDKDGDGVAEETQRLVSDIAFDYKGRPADHTTNGISLGVDGWLYIAGGDFAFMNATGADGTRLQHRAGGVLRVRPDGSGLEVYATGTRNILEVAISPEMEMFTRDNTNDGGGWDVRFHHFTGLTDHGYPRLYKNFSDEITPPVSDYGGGSGCGAVYIDEPGFGEWNNAPFTADWGRGALFRHSLRPKGATYVEKGEPKPFIQLYRPTDGDVDALSQVYLASWKGATFNWEGPDVGFIVKVKPQGFTPGPLPDFATLSNSGLVGLCASDSYRRRIEAQRELLRRGLPDEAVAGLSALAVDPEQSLAVRATALFAFTRFPEKGAALAGAISRLPANPGFDVLVARGTAENAAWVAEKHGGSFDIPPHWTNQPATLVQLNRLVSNTPSWNGETRRAVFDLTLGNSDRQVRHTAVLALAKLGDHALALEFAAGERGKPGHKGNSLERTDALRALARMHRPEAVDGLIALLAKTGDAKVRRDILAALARLHFHEGEWKGDSWGTRPDTRGPYYQPEPWSETPKIIAALKQALAVAGPDEAAFIVAEMSRNRIQSDDALQRVLVLAKEDPRLLPEACAQVAAAADVPAAAIPLLIAAAGSDPSGMAPEAAATMLSNAVIALMKTDSAEGAVVSLKALDALRGVPGSGKEQEAARDAFQKSPKLESHVGAFAALAAKTGTPQAMMADATLLTLAERDKGTPESRDHARRELDAGWADPRRREQILRAVQHLGHQPYADRVRSALDDPDPAVAKAAADAAGRLGIRKTEDKGPLVGSLKTGEVIAKVMETQGDPQLGEQVFARATCVSCHTVSADQTPKGPYLGNIANTYSRESLAEAILDPGKTVAQGFATNIIVTKDDRTHMGFVTLESADKVTLRDAAGTETTIGTKDIKSREKPEISMMPPGLAAGLTVHEFASLLDYLEALAE